VAAREGHVKTVIEAQVRPLNLSDWVVGRFCGISPDNSGYAAGMDC
jgi:hypothetical protein